MVKVNIVTGRSNGSVVRELLEKHNVSGMVQTDVKGVCHSNDGSYLTHGDEHVLRLLPKVQFEVVVEDNKLQEILSGLKSLDISCTSYSQVLCGCVCIQNLNHI